MKILFYVILTIASLYGLYFLITCMFSLYKSENIILNDQPKSKFAILIASRNEEDVIENLIKSLLKQNYPKNLFDIFVIPNNCTDNTEEISKNAGAKIINCDTLIKSKGEALRFAFNKLKDEKYDAYVIFDADNVVHPNFLINMDYSLSSGYKVAQGFRDSKNPSDNWLSGSYSLFYWIQNIFFNRSRMMINGSSSINGTGFMIKKEIIDSYGFETVTLTEDMEFTAQCALNNIKIAYVENAITYDEQPTEFSQSWKQRKRWSIGNMQCFRKYGKKLLKKFLEVRNIACLDMFLVFAFPYLQILLFGLVFIRLIILNNIKFLVFDLIILFILYLLNVVLNIFVVKYNNKNIKSLLSGIFLFMVFTITWIPINIICIFIKDTKWEQIKHKRNINIEQIIK